jgi:phosphatidylinositol-3-phosphatase
MGAQNAPATPPLGHVVVVALENHSYNDVVGSSSMPFYNSLISRYGLAQNFFANVHGSFPDYAMLTSGELITANGSGLPSDFPLSIDNIEREVIQAGKTWKVYAENLPSVGYTGSDQYPYLKRHNPFAYMSDNLGTSQAQNIVPFSQFATDLANNALPNFSFVVPNAINCSEDCPGGGSCSDSTKLSTADQWLQTNIQPLLTNPAFQKDGLLVLWWDEGNAADTNQGGGQVAVVLAGPTIKPGFRSTTFYRHENVLRTIAEGLGLGFPGASIYVVSMGEFFGPSTTPGSISGHVTNSATGAAIAGATVSFSGGSTTTDSSGAYSFNTVPPGTYSVTASGNGFTSQTNSVTVSSGATATLDFHLTASSSPGAITGHVTNASTGAAIAGATVSFSGGSTTTDSSGAYSFSNVAPGTYNVTASQAGFNSQTGSVTVSSGATSTLNFQLSAAPSPGAFMGHVTNASTGAAIAGATVSFSGGSTTTDSNGAYSFTNVAPGAYSVTASQTGFTSQTGSVTVNSGATSTLDFQLSPASTPGTITGRVTNITTGGAVSGATVSFSGGSTTADSSGNYTFTNVTPGTYNVTATHTGYFPVTKAATVASGAAVTVNFALATGGKIAGTVTNASGAAIAGASVTVKGGSISTTVNLTTNSSGGYNSNWIPVGSYTVTVTASGHAAQSKTATANTGATTTLNFTLQ